MFFRRIAGSFLPCKRQGFFEADMNPDIEQYRTLSPFTGRRATRWSWNGWRGGGGGGGGGGGQCQRGHDQLTVGSVTEWMDRTTRMEFMDLEWRNGMGI